MQFELQKPKGGMKQKLIPLLVILGIVGALATTDRWLPGRKILQAVVPSGVQALKNDVGTNTATNVKIELPSGRPVTLSPAKAMRFYVMQWGAQNAFYLANGGPITLADSKLGKLGAQVTIINENDSDVIKDQLVAAVNEWVENGEKGNPLKGTHGVIFMGDGMPGYLPGWNKQLGQICRAHKFPESDCEVRITGAVGSSYGEDKHMVPVEWKNDPRQALASVSGRYEMIAAYYWDGDHVLGLDWAAQNHLPVNPSDKVFDIDAVNFFNARDFIDAGNKHIERYCTTMNLVSHGKPLGRTHEVCVVGADTWTPGDWNISKSARDNLVVALSTKENRNQMAATVIVPNGIAKQHADDIAAIFAATSQAANMIKTNKAALLRAATIATQIYAGNAKAIAITAQQWADLFGGIPHRTQNGYDITLGGSRVWNLADNFDYYGLNGGENVYDAVYTHVGQMISELDPNVVPRVRPLSEIFDPSYLQKAKTMLGDADLGTVESVHYDSAPITDVYASRPYTINFDPGLATIKADSADTLRRLYQALATNELKVSIIGHTDNTGGPSFDNQGLSERRASAVKEALIALAHHSKDFPEKRFQIEGRGASEPVDPSANQDSDVERAKNRRVVITLGR